jgi:chromosomal replication initiation ATPase DnaA
MAEDITWKKALAAVIAEQAGPVTPLFVYYPVSAGRIDLLDTIRSAVGKERSGLYLSARQFCGEFIRALRADLSVFRRNYHDAPLLVVDGFQEIAGKFATQVEFLRTINARLHEGRQVIIGADRPLTELCGLTPELVACLDAGTTCRAEDG